MFRAVRSWWAGASAKVTLRLFLFELIVVIAGVLIAQALAGWASDRAAQRDMRDSKSLADTQISRMAATALAYQKTIPCMNDRIVQVMRAASGEGEVDPKWLERPLMWQFTYTPLSEESLLQLGKQSGEDVADRYLRFVDYSSRARELNYALSNDWQALKIIDPGTGAIGDDDRSQARQLSSRLWSTLKNLEHLTQNIGYRANDLGIKPRLAAGQRMPRGCNDLWTWNAVIYDPGNHLPAGDRSAPKP